MRRDTTTVRNWEFFQVVHPSEERPGANR